MELWMIIPTLIFLDLLFTFIVFSTSDYFMEVNPIFFALIQKFGAKGIIFGGLAIMPIVILLSPTMPRELIIFLLGIYFIIMIVHFQNFLKIATKQFSKCPYMNKDGMCKNKE
ncbi:unnamed protein product [marine sediment metagenome]|uniref:Uncharacterized protein n=1 Tax=marine sediment metagenome TaxID=412755 RepID=X0VW78_9ZZZZ